MAEKIKKLGLIGFLLLILISFLTSSAWAEPLTIPNIQLNINGQGSPQEVVNSVKLLVLLTILALVPAFLLLMTSFTRIVVVLSLLRNALGTQQAPPNQVLIGLAVFLTIFIMSPVINQINQQAIQPYLNNKISQEQAIRAAEAPLKDFMLKQTREKDLALFIDLAKLPRPRTKDDVPFTVVVPAFIISELKTAFQMGFMLFIPFLIIDMVVASILMSMGMFMIPPMLVALPFKLLLFVLADGWYLVVKSLVTSFS
ncbi:flagellar biosynthetic protein FliP [Carboxydothermus pertinax]|uniref:Flagellar biosynthetic protein FliP n=1 Tax=Carboxydothermus pertinax TaxID=870242 RepID=A0A1L8CUJ6_9THEO|nr:flagellar type III secretion system pore protein FliP [Carboxydothermus pertinax]GAV22572.1 flagellar biosynthetic protein FliP [Carboxydothermus pertinax]